MVIQDVFCSNFVILCCFCHWYTITELFSRSESGQPLKQKVNYRSFFFNFDYSNCLEEGGRSATVVPRISYNALPIRYSRFRCICKKLVLISKIIITPNLNNLTGKNTVLLKISGGLNGFIEIKFIKTVRL